MNNARYIEIREKDGSKRNVLSITSGYGTDEPVIASTPIPFEQGNRYVLSFDGRCDDRPYPLRIYIRGYKWKPGIRPCPNPHLGDLRLVFKGKAITSLSRSWKKYTRDFPYFSKGKSSKLSLKHLRPVKFIVFYAVIAGGSDTRGTVFIDNVTIRRK